MSSVQIREELHDFINNADERILNLMYAMVQADLKEGDYKLSANHKKILDTRISDHKSNPDAGSSWKDVKSRIEDQL